jgi:hypothetical protein
MFSLSLEAVAVVVKPLVAVIMVPVAVAVQEVFVHLHQTLLEQEHILLLLVPAELGVPEHLALEELLVPIQVLVLYLYHLVVAVLQQEIITALTLQMLVDQVVVVHENKLPAVAVMQEVTLQQKDILVELLRPPVETAEVVVEQVQ